MIKKIQKNLAKKLLISAGLSLLIGSQVINAATVAITLAAGVGAQLIGTNSGGMLIKQIVATATTTNAANTFSIYDAPNVYTQYTNGTYTNFVSYATNLVVSWINYYGATNSVTNLTLVDITNVVTGGASNYPVRIAGNIPANGTIKYDTVNYYFGTGVLITNQTGGSQTFTITFQQ